MNISRSSLINIAAICMAFSGLGAASAQSLPILSVEVFSVTEFARTYPIVLKLSAPSAVDVRGRLSADGSTRHNSAHTEFDATPGPSCENGVDFIPLINRPFIIPAGQLSTTLETSICGDGVAEENEHFVVTVHRDTLVGARCETGLRNRCDHTPDILNNDDDPAHAQDGIRIYDVLIREPSSGTVNAEVTVRLARTTTEPVTVDYHTVAGTASDRGHVAPPLFRRSVAMRNPDACTEAQFTPGFGLKKITYSRDFLPRSGTVTIAANSDRATISIPICADRFAEGQEHFFVVISNGARVSSSGLSFGEGIARGRALVSIH
jgi:hypothetical protein